MTITFIYGVITGGLVALIGQYYVKKFIDNRGGNDHKKNKKIEMDKLIHEFPDFMTTLQNSLNESENMNIREFFVVDKNAIINSYIPRFRYELTPEILPALNRLEGLGYILKLENNCLHYKIEEDFIIQLVNSQ